MSSFFTELRRRNVIRVAGLYLVGAWLMVQVAETLLPVFGTPDWVLKALVVLLALGFVPALIVSWVFELTPQGLKRESEIDPAHSIVDQTARRLDIAVIVLLLGIGGLMLWQQQQREPESVERGSESLSGTDQATRAIDPRAENDSDPLSVTDKTAPHAAPVAGAKSIAVLPFANMSGEAENEFFSDGVSEEILNSLARIDGMQVVGRTSSFRFKGKNDDLRQIGAQLGVANVLEGSVRRGNDRVRITAQLIQVSDGIHLWSQTYDRTLTDALAVQLDIAESVAGALDVVMDEAQRERMREAGVKNVDAFIAFQKARKLFSDAHDPARSDNLIATLRLADVEFAKATALEPDFAAAYYFGTDLYNHIVMSESAAHEEREAALYAARRHLDLAARSARDPQERLIIEVERQLVSDDWRGLAVRLKPAIEQQGHRQGNWMLVGFPFGLADARLASIGGAISRDPLSLLGYNTGAQAAHWAGKPEKVLELVAEGNRTMGGGAPLTMMGVKALVSLGQVDEARALVATLEADSTQSTVGHLMVGAALGEDVLAINERLRRTRKPGWNPEYWFIVDGLAEALADDRDAGNRRAAAIDAQPGGTLKLAVFIALCQCGVPFDLGETPNFEARLAESGLPWPPPDLIATLRSRRAEPR